MARKLAIITGTFNPVTKAHIKLAMLAVKEIQDAMVIYVPAKNQFLKEWKHLDDSDIMSESERVDILSQAIKTYGFVCDTCEITGEVPGDTYNTLHYLAKKYGASIDETYYICGSDKLSEIKKWYNSDLLLREFKFLVVRRTNDKVERLINQDKFLSENKERFRILPGDEFFQDVSATKVRQAINTGSLTEVREFLPEEAYYYLESRCQK